MKERSLVHATVPRSWTKTIDHAIEHDFYPNRSQFFKRAIRNELDRFIMRAKLHEMPIEHYKQRLIANIAWLFQEYNLDLMQDVEPLEGIKRTDDAARFSGLLSKLRQEQEI